MKSGGLTLRETCEAAMSALIVVGTLVAPIGLMLSGRSVGAVAALASAGGAGLLRALWRYSGYRLPLAAVGSDRTEPAELEETFKSP